MRIALSADNDSGLDSVISPHFGRCPYYVFVDVEEQEVASVRSAQNPFYGQHRPGAVPGFINDQGANVMLTGGMGRRAVAFFEQLGIEAVTGASGTVRQALEQYLGGRLRGAEPCGVSVAHAHAEYEKDEVGRLREETEMLRRHLDDTMARLDELGKK